MNMTTPSFDDLLTLIEDRSAALRTAVAGPPVLAPVPGCPDWSVHDLLAHLGQVQRFWAAVVAAGPADRPPGNDVPGHTPDDGLLAWSAESTAMLIGALRQAGPDRGCWTWWTATGAPATSGAVARHQVQEAAVHGRDAQEAAGHPEPVPAAIATDSVDEFLAVSLGSAGAWPHQPARVSLRATEGPEWLIDLGEQGALVVSADAEAAGRPEPAMSLTGNASDLLLILYDRIGSEAAAVSGDRGLLRQLIDWAPRD